MILEYDLCTTFFKIILSKIQSRNSASGPNCRNCRGDEAITEEPKDNHAYGLGYALALKNPSLPIQKQTLGSSPFLSTPYVRTYFMDV